VLYPELEHAPFAIDHGDLAPLNIIVDSEYNVTGYVVKIVSAYVANE